MYLVQVLEHKLKVLKQTRGLATVTSRFRRYFLLHHLNFIDLQDLVAKVSRSPFLGLCCPMQSYEHSWYNCSTCCGPSHWSAPLTLTSVMLTHTKLTLSLITILVALEGIESFAPHSPTGGICSPPQASCSRSRLLSTSDNDQPTEVPREDELSDLDARVLQSMLQDGSLDLTTEDDMLKLLERASGPKDAPKPASPSDSDYESQTLQALLDTKLWKALSAKKDDLLESAKIYIENRIERDTKLLASLGLFVWDRVVRDVARALPAAGSSGAAVGRAVRTATKQLGSASSFRDVVNEAVKSSTQPEKLNLQDVNLYEELNTPLDEIKSVTQAIQDILKGETSASSSQRGIRSAAPAGQKTRTERQQRAYQKRKQTVLKREKEGLDVRRVAGTVVDAAYEVRRDLQVEVNKPGYKTERVRTAIAAGAETTSRVIAAARDGQPGAWKNILFGSKAKEQVLELESADSLLPVLPDLPEIPSEPVLVAPLVPLPAELLDEQASVVSRLKLCIEKPEDTWLTQTVLASTTTKVDSDALRDVVTAMIIARDDLTVTEPEPKSMKNLISNLRKVKSTIDAVNAMAEASAGPQIANNMRNILYGYDPDDEIQPTLLALDDIQAIYQKDVIDAEKTAEAMYEAAVEERERAIVEWEKVFNERERIIQQAKEIAANLAAEEALAAATAEAAMSRRQTRAESGVATDVTVDTTAIDASFEKSRSTAPRYTSSSDVEVVVDDFTESAVAEVVIDDYDVDDEDVILRTVSDVLDDEEDEPNLLADVTLRSLDVVLAVSEKAILLLPGVIKVAVTASSRLDNVSRGGLGRIGWNRLGHTDKGSKRY